MFAGIGFLPSLFILCGHSNDVARGLDRFEHDDGDLTPVAAERPAGTGFHCASALPHLSDRDKLIGRGSDRNLVT